MNNLTKLSGGKIDVFTLNFHFFTEHEKICHQSPYSIDYALRKRCYVFVTAAAASPSIWHWMCYELWQSFSFLCITTLEWKIGSEHQRHLFEWISTEGIVFTWFGAVLHVWRKFWSFHFNPSMPAVRSIGVGFK